MAKTTSNMMPLGTEAPDFSLLDVTNNKVLDFNTVQNKKGYVIMFICNHCPFVIHLHQSIQDLYHDYKNKNIQFIAINSNDIEQYPEDSPEKMKQLFQKSKLDFPYLYDETQNIAKAYDAACTPDFYLFDNNKQCTYRGQLDDARPHQNTPSTGKDLRNALNCLLENKTNTDTQKPSMGCNIKWKY